MNTYLDNTIEVLENKVWEYKKFPTILIETCHNARKKKIRDLSLNELRTLLTQDIGVPYILPSVMAALEKDLLTDTRFYPGDLLLAAVSMPERTWRRPEHEAIGKKLKSLLDNARQDAEWKVNSKIEDAVSRFSGWFEAWLFAGALRAPLVIANEMKPTSASVSETVRLASMNNLSADYARSLFHFIRNERFERE
ncbi:contact-dependent growth inhibition system immunity protein [Chitinophaga horti]|uniref:Contact-dependent growth inhibition system immunity protein n=1 Tax=Chitinophaga horti TaxID=2920382 RepID=A0ABY6J2A8_9BACT|nr:contact-dependent growth inhibition system immunity protein [Chitinophaga horti]UYQ93786.1 contact-dependent growth inhibition system immunity protein [Chitinophaga horti]